MSYSDNLLGASSKSTTTTPTAPPVDPIFTRAGDSDFSSWDTQNLMSVQLGAAVSPSGKRDASRLIVDNYVLPGQQGPTGWMAKTVITPFARPAFIIFTKKGSGAQDGGAFAMWNDRTQKLFQLNLNYDDPTKPQLGSGVTGAVSPVTADGWLQVTVIPPVGSINAGDRIYVYPGWTGQGVMQPGIYNYAWGARIVDPATVNNTMGRGAPFSRMEKIALAGLALGLLFRNK